MRVKYQRAPITTEWTVGRQGQHRRRHHRRRKAGRRTGHHGGRGVGPTVPLVGAPWFALSERNSPGSIIVNMTGKRFMNESMPYVEACHRMYGGTYGQGPVPGENIRPGWSSTSGTAIATSSRDCNQDSAFRRSGWSRASLSRLTRWRSWRRGPVCRLTSSPDSRADQRLRPHGRRRGLPPRRDQPCRTTPPRWCRATWAPRANPHRYPWPRAARRRSVIDGWYAAGNVNAPVMGHTYPGPGGTFGPAMTFGYLGALHIAGKS